MTEVSRGAGSGDLAPFATTLRAAVEASGLGLERIERRLRDRGTRISIATLSNWQSGRSAPTRPSSLTALAELEAVLGLAPQALAHLLPAREPDVLVGDSISTLAASLTEGDELPEHFARLDARLRQSVEMLSDHITLMIGSDRGQHTRRARRIVRALTDGVDRIVLASHLDDPASPPATITPLSHCSIGARDVVRGSAVVLTELLFDRPLGRGESIMVEFQVDHGSPSPRDTYHELRRQLPLRELVMEVRFHAEARPVRCEWYELSGAPPHHIERVSALAVTAPGSVLVVRRDLPPQRYGIRWFWD